MSGEVLAPLRAGDLVSHVRRGDHPLEYLPPLTKLQHQAEEIIFGASAMLVFGHLLRYGEAGGGDTNLPHPLSYPVTCSLIGLGAVGIEKAITSNSRRRAVRKAINSMESQRQLRKQFGDTAFDIYQEKDKEGNQSVTLRWYGFDEVGLDTPPETLSQLATRFKAITSQATEAGIDYIRIHEPNTGHESYKSLTKLRSAGKSSAISCYDSREDKRKNTHTEKVVGAYVTLPTAYAKQIADSLPIGAEHCVNEQLVAIIEESRKQSRVPGHYRSFLQSPTEKSMQALLAVLRTEIAAMVDEDMPSVQLDKLNPSAGPQRSHSTTTIRGRHALQTHTSPAQNASEAATSVTSSSLLALSGASSTEQLKERTLIRINAMRPTDAHISFYLALLDDPKPQYASKTVADDIRLGHKTMFDRLTKNGHFENTIIETNGSSYMCRMVGMVALSAAISFGISHADKLVDNYAQSAQDTTSPASVSVPNWQELQAKKNRTAYKQNTSGATELALDIYAAANSGAYTLYGQVDKITRQISWVRDGSESNAEPRVPSINFNNFGDAKPEANNTALYIIEPLSDNAHLAGKWAVAQNNLLYEDTRRFRAPLRIRSEQYGYDFATKKLPMTPHSTALFRVTALLNPGYPSRIELPFADGTKVVAAHFAETDPSSPMYGIRPRPINSILTGLYDVSTKQSERLSSTAPNSVGLFGVQNMAAYHKPAIIYWLGPDTEPQQRAVTPMLYSKDLFEPASTVPASLQKAARYGLGLDDSASDTDVLDAIKSKRYAFTPLEDSARSGTPTVSPTVNQLPVSATEQDIVKLAQLPSGNCNTSTLLALLALSGQYEGKPVNQQVGFQNNNDNVLTVNEAHSWLIDGDGNKLDPTATGGSSGTETSVRQKEQDPLLPALVGAGLLTAAGITLRKRKQIGARTQARQRRVIRTRLAHNNTPAVHHGLHVVTHKLYSPSTSAFDPKHYASLAQQPLTQRLSLLSSQNIRELRHAIRNDGRYSGRDARAAARALRLSKLFSGMMVQ